MISRWPRIDERQPGVWGKDLSWPTHPVGLLRGCFEPTPSSLLKVVQTLWRGSFFRSHCKVCVCVSSNGFLKSEFFVLILQPSNAFLWFWQEKKQSTSGASLSGKSAFLARIGGNVKTHPPLVFWGLSGSQGSTYFSWLWWMLVVGTPTHLIPPSWHQTPNPCWYLGLTLTDLPPLQPHPSLDCRQALRVILGSKMCPSRYFRWYVFDEEATWRDARRCAEGDSMSCPLYYVSFYRRSECLGQVLIARPIPARWTNIQDYYPLS